MADETRSNLEPIDESDLNLQEKFTGESGNDLEKGPSLAQETKPETIPAKEQTVERKEGGVEKEAAYSKILSQMPAISQPANDDEVAADAAKAHQEIDVESKIKSLVNIAEVKGIPHAVKVARHMEDNYALDEFHDRLMGEELHDALLKKGLIKEI